MAHWWMRKELSRIQNAETPETPEEYERRRKHIYQHRCDILLLLLVLSVAYNIALMLKFL